MKALVIKVNDVGEGARHAIRELSMFASESRQLPFARETEANRTFKCSIKSAALVKVE